MEYRSKQMETIEADAQAELDKDSMIRRLTSDLERCHQESVKLMAILLDVAACVGCKRDSNYMTIKELKGWAKAQAEARKLPSMQAKETNK